MIDDTKFPRLTEGQIVWNQGHEFIATDVEYFADGDLPSCEILRYRGVCTDHTANDSIRRTGFNGGTYGYRVNKAPGLTDADRKLLADLLAPTPFSERTGVLEEPEVETGDSRRDSLA